MGISDKEFYMFALPHNKFKSRVCTIAREYGLEVIETRIGVVCIVTINDGNLVLAQNRHYLVTDDQVGLSTASYLIYERLEHLLNKWVNTYED